MFRYRKRGPSVISCWCPKCGKKNEGNLNFCKVCGTSLKPDLQLTSDSDKK